MSKQVDERVVSMQFDNKNFENNIKTSMSTLERFKQCLQFKGVTKGFDDINSASKKVDMSPMAKGLETVQARFSALQVIGVTALSNITNSAVNAGKRIVKALTLEPVTTGFSEYETKINSIQTIMSNTASKGTTMEDVTRVINELNTYADKTIYNFAEMTRNIGTFTAAGVGLEESAAAIQGIANLAAASGSTSQQASTAMYQLSQALASGTVKLMDWNSVVNAGMGGEKFQEALKATAREHGIAVDSIVEKAGSFRDSLKEEWVSADILNETLNKFTVDGAKNYAESMLKSGKYTQEQADALVKEAQAMEDAATKVKTFTQLFDTMKESVQSGWAQTWEIIIGDFEEAKEFLSGLSETFGKIIDGISNARNKLLSGGLDSKWDQLNKKIEAAGLSTEEFQNIIIETAKKSGIPIDDLIKKHGSLAKVIAKGKIPANIFTKALKKLIGSEEKVTSTTKDLDDVAKKVIQGTFGNGEDRVKALTKAGYDYAAVQNKVNELLGSSVRHTSKLTDEQIKNADQLVKLSDEQLKNKGYTEEQIEALRELEKAAEGSDTSINKLIQDIEKPSGRTLLLDSVYNVLKAIGKILKAVRDAWKATFDPMTGDDVYGFVEGLNRFTEALIISDDTANNFQKVMEGLFSLFKLSTAVITKGLITGLKLASAVLSLFGTNLLEVAAFLADYIVKFRIWVEENTMFINSIDKLAVVIKTIGEGIKKCVDAFLSLDAVSNAIKRFKQAFKDFFGDIEIGFGSFSVENFCKSIEKAFDALAKWIKGLNNSENIGRDILNGLINGLKSGVQRVANFVINIAKTIIDTFCGVLGIHSPSTVFFAIGGFILSGLILGIVNAKTGLFTTIGNLFKNLFSKIKEHIQPIKDWLMNLDLPDIKLDHILGLGAIVGLIIVVKKVLDVFTMFGKGVEGFGDMCSGAGDVMSAFADRISPKKNKWVEISNAVLKMSIAIAILAGSVALLTEINPGKLWNAVGVIAALAAIIAGLTLAASKLNAKGGDINKLSWLLVGLSASVFLMASAIKKLEFLNKDNIGPVITGLIFMIGSVMTLVLTVGKLTKGTIAKNIDKASIVITKLSLTMLLLSFAIKSVSKLEPEGLKRGLITLTIFGAFIAALIFTTKLAGPNIQGLGSTLIGITATMMLMVGVIKLVNKLEPSEITKGVTCIALFGGIITGLIAATKLAGGNTKGVGRTMIGIAAAMTVMALTVKISAGLSPEELKKGLTCIAVFGAVVVALIAAVSKVQGKIKGVGATILSISIAMGVLAALAIVLSMISLEGLTKGVTAVSILGGMMALIIHSLKGAEKAKGTIVAITVALSLLIGAVIGLSFVDPSKLASATTSISMIMGMFTLLMQSTSKATNTKQALRTLFSMLGVVAGLAVIIAALSLIENPESVIKTAAALSLVMLSLSTSMVILGKTGRISSTVQPLLLPMFGVVTGLAAILGIMSKLKAEASIPSAVALGILLNAMAAALVIIGYVAPTAAASMGAMGILTAIVAGLATILGIMSALNVEASIPSAIALGILLNAMAAALVILNFVAPTATGAVGAMALLGLVVAELAVILGVMSALNIEVSIPTATALSILLLSMSAALTILSLVGAAGPAAFIGIGALATMIAGIGGLIIAIGALNEKFPQIEQFLNSGIPVLEKIGNAIGSFFGNIIGGFLGGITDGLPTIGTNLGLFMKNAQPFIDGAKQLDASAAEGVRALVDAFLVLTATNVLDKLTSWFAGDTDFSKFGTDIASFGGALKQFSDKVAGVDTEAVKAAATAGKTLADMANTIPNEGGVAAWWAGENSISKFGTDIVSFGGALKQFSDKVAGVDTEAVKAASTAGKALADMANTIPNEGGMAAWFAGENSVSKFGTDIVSFGDSLKQFSDKVAGIDTEAVKAASTAGKILAAMADTIPNEGGVAAWFAGENSVSKFGTDIVSFGDSLKQFSVKVAGIDTEAVKAASTAGKALATMANTVPNQNGVVQWFSGEKSISAFGEQIVKFGASLKGFSDKVKGIDNDSVIAGAAAGVSLANMTKQAPAEKDLSKFCENIEKVGSAISRFATDVKGAAIGTSITQINKLINMATKMQGVAGTLNKFADGLKKLSSVSVDDFCKSFTGSPSKLSSAINKFVKAGIDAAKKKETDFKKVAKELVNAFANAISKNSSTVKSKSKAMAKAGADAAKSKQSDFKSAGKYVVEGFANGISANTFKAEAKARAMALAALAAAKRALDEHSPSREFYRVGAYGGQGFINAFIDYIPKSLRAGKNLAESATVGLAKATSKIRNILDGTVDTQPTIRPVLDLSDIRSGAGAISGLFGMNPSVSLLSNLGSISASMNGQNGNADVISAITKLGRKLGNIQGTTYNINGVTYEEGTEVANAIQVIARAATIERRR